MATKKLTLADLLLLKIQALYDIETEVAKALPKMVKKASAGELEDLFAEHLEETEAQIERLEHIFRLLGEKPKKNKTEAIRGLVKDAQWVMKNIRPSEALDANLVAAAQYVEHYEMAGYGTALEWAMALDQPDIADLLGQSLDEEKNADQKLTNLALSGLNDLAMP